MNALTRHLGSGHDLVFRCGTTLADGKPGIAEGGRPAAPGRNRWDESWQTYLPGLKQEHCLHAFG
jgi:hypothetical protein